MTFERTKRTWEVKLQPPSGEQIIEKVQAYWSPAYEGIKEAVALAAQNNAWRRNKKKIEFVILGEAVLIDE